MALIASIFIALPWFNPFSAGPLPSVMPWLAALACSAPSLAFNSVASFFSQRVRVDDMVATVWLAAALLSAWAGVLHDFGTASLFAPWVNSRAVGED